MVGITSYGAYIPMLRLALGKPGGPEKAVANWDEDCVTMAVAAAIDALKGIDRRTIDGVLFASTSYTFKEKQGAAIIAKALDLRRDVHTADIGDTLRAGTNALRAGADAIKAGSAKRVLVCVGEVRQAAPRSGLEANIGDGAAAFVVGEGDDVALSLEAAHSIADEIIDVWRTEGDQFVHAWEDRFVVDHGYRASVREVVKGLLAKVKLTPKDIGAVAVFGPDARAHATAVKELGFEGAQIIDPLFGKVGNCGAAFAPLLLVAALERAKAGEKVLCVGYGDGADALLFAATPQVERIEGRRGVAWHLARRGDLPGYDMYMRFRNFIATEHDRRAGAGLSATKHFRDRDSDITLLAQKCRRCGQTQFPRQRVCYSCFAKDEFEPTRLSDKVGTVRSFTFDNFAGSPNPPMVAGIVDIEGARLYVQMTDVNAKEVKLGMPVEMTFRKIHDAGGTPNYFWKSTPVR